jgi:phage terminase small subunit
MRTAKQEQFCQEFIVDLNATQAAIRAGYSARCARQAGPENMKKPAVAARIAELQAERAQRIEITAEQTLADLREAADIALGRKEYPKTVIVDGEPHTVMIKNVNLAAAARALELLGRHQGLFNDKLQIQHSGLDSLLEAIAEVASSTPAGRIKARVGQDSVH